MRTLRSGASSLRRPTRRCLGRPTETLNLARPSWSSTRMLLLTVRRRVGLRRSVALASGSQRRRPRFPVMRRKIMIRLARISLAMPGKIFELLAVLKEAAAVVKSVTGVEVTIFSSMGARVGEYVSVSNYSSLADFEEKMTKLLDSAEWQAMVKKFEGLNVPGSTHDH